MALCFGAENVYLASDEQQFISQTMNAWMNLKHILLP